MEYSVLMTVYGKDDPVFFDTALKSMLNQTKSPNEIVLVKDGPVPQAIQEIIDVADRNYPDKIVQVSLKENVGLGLALNEGIKVCKNELIARMDSDDISISTRCEKQVRAFESNPFLDIIGCPVIEFEDSPENPVGKREVPFDNDSIYRYARKRDPFNHPTVMYKKSKVVEVGGYDDLRKNQDTDLWIKMLSKGAVCQNLEECLLYFRFDKNTYKKRKNWANTKSLIGVRWKAYKMKRCSFFDFLQVAFLQMAIFIMPVKFQEFIYKKILRR